MALFKILKGDSSRISTDVTPFHDGYAYFTPDDSGFYIDSEDNGIQKRHRINPEGGGFVPVVAENVQIPSSAWTQTDTYDDYPFSATATVTGMTADMIPEVVFALTDAISGTFAPVAASTVDGVTIYAAEHPAETLTVPTIIGWPKNTQ